MHYLVSLPFQTVDNFVRITFVVVELLFYPNDVKNVCLRLRNKVMLVCLFVCLLVSLPNFFWEPINVEYHCSTVNFRTVGDVKMTSQLYETLNSVNSINLVRSKLIDFFYSSNYFYFTEFQVCSTKRTDICITTSTGRWCHIIAWF